MHHGHEIDFLAKQSAIRFDCAILVVPWWWNVDVYVESASSQSCENCAWQADFSQAKQANLEVVTTLKW